MSIAWQSIYIIYICFSLSVHFSSRERVCQPREENGGQNDEADRRSSASVATTLHSPPKMQQHNGLDNTNANPQNGQSQTKSSTRSFLKSASISASKCVSEQGTELEVGWLRSFEEVFFTLISVMIIMDGFLLIRPSSKHKRSWKPQSRNFWFFCHSEVRW